MATVIREWFNDRLGGVSWIEGCDTPALNDAHSGCGLFKDTFSFATGGGDRAFSSHECEADLFLVFDGGILYDFLSPEGDAEAMGAGWNWPLQQFIEDKGWEMEDVTSYCISIRRDS